MFIACVWVFCHHMRTPCACLAPTYATCTPCAHGGQKMCQLFWNSYRCLWTTMQIVGTQTQVLWWPERFQTFLFFRFGDTYKYTWWNFLGIRPMSNDKINLYSLFTLHMLILYSILSALRLDQQPSIEVYVLVHSRFMGPQLAWGGVQSCSVGLFLPELLVARASNMSFIGSFNWEVEGFLLQFGWTVRNRWFWICFLCFSLAESSRR